MNARVNNHSRLANGMSVDVEDYFQVSAMAPYISRASWDSIPCRVERNVEVLLAMFAAHGSHCTFFTLGWIAERFPQLVRKIVAEGHELASHGYSHLRATDQTRTEFLSDIVRARKLLEDVAGVPVIGYRAPSFSIGSNNLWAFDCIAEAGYRYSSSVYPVHHDHYGMPDAPRFPYQSREGLVEIPITTARAFGRNFPAGGGGYFRFAPYLLSKWAIRRVNEQEKRPAIFYLHPWEVDPEQPRVAGIDAKTKFRHYLNLGRMEARLTRLNKDFLWDRVDRAFQADLN